MAKIYSVFPVSCCHRFNASVRTINLGNLEYCDALSGKTRLGVVAWGNAVFGCKRLFGSRG